MVDFFNTISELTNIKLFDLTFSISDLKYMVPDTRVLYILALFIIFAIFCIWDNVWSDKKNKQKSGRNLNNINKKS